LECLKNLKELKADENTITDISGIAKLDGLVKLSVANNRIESLDVGRTKW
jgi:Leucine-rich repeat (LRR) protein